MDINNFFTQIGDFWDRISIPLLFHLIFFLLYKFIYGAVSVKTQLENYLKSEKFTRTKAILSEFELWKKFPFILIVILLIYLTLFNSVTEIISSFKIFPFKMSYSQAVFLTEYEPVDNIIDIAKYGHDSIPNLFFVEQLKEKFLEEYKAKYPEKFASWVKWVTEQYGNRIRFLNLTALTIIILLIFFIKNIFSKKRKKKILSSFKFCLVILLSVPILFIIRYKMEQSIEERFINEIMFVKTSLETDLSRETIFSSSQINLLSNHLRDEIKKGKYFDPPSIWISRIVGSNHQLEYLLGHRKLRNIKTINDNIYK